MKSLLVSCTHVFHVPHSVALFHRPGWQNKTWKRTVTIMSVMFHFDSYKIPRMGEELSRFMCMFGKKWDIEERFLLLETSRTSLFLMSHTHLMKNVLQPLLRQTSKLEVICIIFRHPSLKAWGEFEKCAPSHWLSTKRRMGWWWRTW